MKKSSKGITLIALIITIIVLVVIAGVSLAALTSDNGVLRQTNTAKVTVIEGTAREQMDLACSVIRLAIAEANAKDNSYSAMENTELIQNVLLNTIKADSKELKEDGWKSGTIEGNGKFIITYEGEDYKNACNDNEAKITYTITLGQKSIEIIDIGTGIKGPDGSNTTIDIGAGSGSTTPVTPPSTPPTESAYLVDEVEIGDYVDIGISYTNENANISEDETTSELTVTPLTSDLTGWRVLSKSGNGADGVVTLVSAGVPLVYYNNECIVIPPEFFRNLDEEKTFVTDLLQPGYLIMDEYGINNGLGYNNLSSVWDSNTNINGSTAHTVTGNEICVLIKELTGEILENFILDGQDVNIDTETQRELAQKNGKTWNERANDLIEIGLNYFIDMGTETDFSSSGTLFAIAGAYVSEERYGM